MAGQYRFKDQNGNIVAQISASVEGAIAFSGSVVDFSQANNVILGNVQLAGTASNALLLDGFDSQAFAFTSSIHPFTASIAGTNTFTSSAKARLDSIETISASNVSRLNSLEIKTGSLATTGSNVFIGTQTITGSLFISSNLIVQGTSSLQNITASAVSIGTNLINLNTANPAIRYAGLVIGDSGSVGGSGSFLYDSVQDEMIFVHRGASSVVTSSVTLMGPETYDNVGSETYLTSNRIPKGTGNEHLGDSNISDNGIAVSLISRVLSGSSANFSGNLTSTGIFQLNDASNIATIQTNSDSNILSIVASTDLIDNKPRIELVGTTYSTNPNSNFYRAGTHVFTSSSASTEYIRITNQGRIGIGNTNPNALLTLRNSATNTRLELDTESAGSSVLSYDRTSSAYKILYLRGSDIQLNPNDVTAMTIKAGGNVGINETSPSSLLHFSKQTTWGTSDNRIININNSGTGGNINVAHNMGSITWYSGNSTPTAEIAAYRNTPASGNNIELRFYTATTGTPIESMRISSTGIITKPYQPFVIGGMDGNQSIGATTFTTLNFSTTTGMFYYANVGNSWNNSNRTFTVPVTGVYMVNVSILTDCVGQVALFVNGVRKHSIPAVPFSGSITWGGSAMIPLTVGESLTLQGYGSTGGTVTQNIYHTFFGIYLLG